MIPSLSQKMADEDDMENAHTTTTLCQPEDDTDILDEELVKKPSDSKLVREAYMQANSRFADLRRTINESETPGSTQFPMKLQIPGSQLQNEFKVLHNLWKSFLNDWADLTFDVENENSNLDPVKRLFEMAQIENELHKSLDNFSVWMNYHESMAQLRTKIQDLAISYIFFVKCVPGIYPTPEDDDGEKTSSTIQEDSSELYEECENEVNFPACTQINDDAVNFTENLPPE